MLLLMNLFSLDFGSNKLLQVVTLFCFIFVMAKVIKLYRKRKHFINILPGRPFRFYNPFENVGDILFNGDDRKRIGLNAWILQVLMGANQLYRNEKLLCVWILHMPFVIISKAEAAKEVICGNMMDKPFLYNFFTPWVGTGLFTSNGSKWKSRRKLFSSAFHSQILGDFMPVFNEKSQILVQRLKKDTDKDFISIIEPIKLCVLDVVCETILGVKINAQDNSNSEYVKAVERSSKLVMERVINYYVWFDFIYYFTEKGKQFRQDLKIIHDFTRSLIKEKKEKLNSKGASQASGKARKALLDLLLEHNVQTQSLTDEEMREEVDTFTVAGHDTESIGITWALYLIGLYKDIQERIFYELDSIFGNDIDRPATLDDLKDMKYLDCVIKESLRLYPAAPVIAKQMSTDAYICGHQIPEGSICIILPYIIHREEDVFPNPEKFDPDRFLPENCVNRPPFSYIPFSAGPRNCIGKKFALMEAKVIISTILRHFTLQSLDQRDQVIPTVNAVLRPSRPLRIQIRPRQVQEKSNQRKIFC